MNNKRHILLITIDCGRADHITGSEATTPHIDTLRRDGITFTQAFSQTNVTIPSLYSLFTSTYLATHGIYSNVRFYPLPSQSLLKILQNDEWKTASFTGIHFVHYLLGQEFDNRVPLGRDLYLSAMQLSFRFPQIKRFLRLNRWNAGELVPRAAAWLDRNSQKHNCFLWIHFFDAHTPYFAPASFIQNDSVDVSKFQTATSPLRDQLAARNLFTPFSQGPLAEKCYDISYFPHVYRIALRYIDSELGHLFQRMKATDLYDNTLVILTSDHGENLVEHGVYCGHRKLFNTTTHVPLILKDFGNARAGQQVDAMVQHIDIAPTILERLGLKTSEKFWGKDLWPVISGKSSAVNDYAFCEHAHNFQRCLRTPEWQYIQSEKDPAKHREVPKRKNPTDHFPFDEPDVLIDRNDPSSRNHIKDHPHIEQHLSQRIKDILAQCEMDHPPQTPLPETLKKQLEGLGYF